MTFRSSGRLRIVALFCKSPRQAPLAQALGARMKPWVLSSILAVSAFGAGLAGALFVASHFEADAWHEAIVASSQQTPWFQAETESEFRLANIEAAQRGDTQTIIRTNCLLLKIGLPAVSPERFGPARVAEVKAFLDHARSTIAELEKQGLCSLASSARAGATSP